MKTPAAEQMAKQVDALLAAFGEVDFALGKHKEELSDGTMIDILEAMRKLRVAVGDFAVSRFSRESTLLQEMTSMVHQEKEGVSEERERLREEDERLIKECGAKMKLDS